jgi:hypothetical protein
MAFKSAAGGVVAQIAARQAAEAALKAAAEAAAKQAAEIAAKQAAEVAAKQAAELAARQAAEIALKKADDLAKEAVEKAAREAMEAAAKKADDAAKQAAKEAAEAATKKADDALKAAAKQADEALAAAKQADELAEKALKNMPKTPPSALKKGAAAGAVGAAGVGLGAAAGGLTPFAAKQGDELLGAAAKQGDELLGGAAKQGDELLGAAGKKLDDVAEAGAKNAPPSTLKKAALGAGAVVLTGAALTAAAAVQANLKDGMLLTIKSIENVPAGLFGGLFGSKEVIITYSPETSLYIKDTLDISATNCLPKIDKVGTVITEIISNSQVKVAVPAALKTPGTSGKLVLQTSIANQQALLGQQAGDLVGGAASGILGGIATSLGLDPAMFSYAIYAIIAVVAMYFAYQFYTVFLASRGFSFGKISKTAFGKMVSRFGLKHGKKA